MYLPEGTELQEVLWGSEGTPFPQMHAFTASYKDQSQSSPITHTTKHLAELALGEGDIGSACLFGDQSKGMGGVGKDQSSLFQGHGSWLGWGRGTLPH